MDLLLLLEVSFPGTKETLNLIMLADEMRTLFMKMSLLAVLVVLYESI